MTSKNHSPQQNPEIPKLSEGQLEPLFRCSTWRTHAASSSKSWIGPRRKAGPIGISSLSYWPKKLPIENNDV